MAAADDRLRDVLEEFRAAADPYDPGRMRELCRELADLTDEVGDSLSGYNAGVLMAVARLARDAAGEFEEDEIRQLLGGDPAEGS